MKIQICNKVPTGPTNYTKVYRISDRDKLNSEFTRHFIETIQYNLPDSATVIEVNVDRDYNRQEDILLVSYALE